MNEVELTVVLTKVICQSGLNIRELGSGGMRLVSSNIAGDTSTPST